MTRWGRRVVFAGLLLGLAACGSTEPDPSLVGTWTLTGFREGGVLATTTGSAQFRGDGTFSITGTVTFPGEPTDPIDVQGTYEEHAGTVSLTVGGQSADWEVQYDGRRATLTQLNISPTNAIILDRAG